jgi:hypothetical protein
MIPKPTLLPMVSMPMPEAAVDENYGSVLRQYDIRPPGQFSAVQAKAKAQPMQKRANPHLRQGVLAANAAHVP